MLVNWPQTSAFFPANIDQRILTLKYWNIFCLLFKNAKLSWKKWTSFTFVNVSFINKRCYTDSKFYYLLPSKENWVLHHFGVFHFFSSVVIKRNQSCWSGFNYFDILLTCFPIFMWSQVQCLNFDALHSYTRHSYTHVKYTAFSKYSGVVNSITCVVGGKGLDPLPGRGVLVRSITK